MTALAVECTPTAPDPKTSAKEAGLRYVSDRLPGISRVRRGHGFTYLLPDGRPLRDEAELARIRALAIPPAWTEVWICLHPGGHLQATGRDARGRKQHRYHSRYRQVRDQTKFDRLVDFARSLPKIRRTTRRHLRLPGLPYDKVMAAVVRLLEQTHIRIGNEEYAKTNRSFGLTTLHNRHVKVNGASMRFHFRGKSGIEHAIGLENRRLARIVRACQDLPGEELFGYVDDEGNPRDVTSADVNDYLRRITGQDFTAKDFRTWAGTVLAAVALRDAEPFASAAQAKKNIIAAVDAVARQLGNTRAVCRKCYIHPRVLQAYENGSLADGLSSPTPPRAAALFADEAAVLSLLRGKRKHRKLAPA